MLRLKCSASKDVTRTTSSPSLGTVILSVSQGDTLLGLRVTRCLTHSAMRLFDFLFSKVGISLSFTKDIHIIGSRDGVVV